MAGSFLFTQNTAGQHGGRSHVQPLLRAANHNTPTFQGAVQTRWPTSWSRSMAPRFGWGPMSPS